MSYEVSRLNGSIKKALNKDVMVGAEVFCAPMYKFSSASRRYMGSNFPNQALPIREPSLPRHMSGYEDQMKDITFQVKTPCDLTVIRIIDDFNPTVAQLEAGIESPRRVIYRSNETGMSGIIHIITYERNAEYFGMKYNILPVAKQLYVNQRLPKDTVLAECSSIINDMFTTSIDVPTAFISTAATIEDGIEIGESWVEKLTPLVVGSKSTKFGKNSFPVMMYGDDDELKGYPEQGEEIRPDGLLYAIREYDELMDCVNLLPENITRPDLVADRLTYAESSAVVYDIEVKTTVFDNKKRDSSSMVTPEAFARQALKGYRCKDNINRRVLDEVENIRLADRNNFRQALEPTLRTEALYALADKPMEVHNASKLDRDIGRITRLQNAVPLEEFNVEVKYRCEFKLGLGLKLANFYGSKGVACRIRPDDEMPIDLFGNRAGIVIHGTANVSRLIASPNYQQHLNAASRDVSKDVRKLMDEGKHDEAWSWLVGYYKIVSEEGMYLLSETVYNTDELKREHLDEIYADGIYIISPTDCTKHGPAMKQRIDEYRKPDQGKVWLTNYQGERKLSINDCLIGEMSCILLEKSATKPMGESTARLQNNGLPAASTVVTRDTRPIKHNPLRSGESEDRAISTTQDSGLLMSEMMELATSPEVTAAAVEEMMTTETPMAIPHLVNRYEIPLGRSRSIAFFNHLYSCAGGKIIEQKPEDIRE